MMFIYGHISRYAGAKFKQFLRWKMKNVNKFFFEYTVVSDELFVFLGLKSLNLCI